MNRALWIVQVLLAIAFGMAGGMKLITPIAELSANGMGFVNDVPELLVRFIGLSEVLGAIGLLLPAALRIAPKLTPIAASGLLIIMVLASVMHISMGELPIPTVALGSLAAFVAWGRFTKAPVEGRSETASAT